ncbi:MAG: hypothetical protein IJ045_06600 [Ruminiclostridium sp.]|nr:hypothetical protein [Ruminiclostridium sp.]
MFLMLLVVVCYTICSLSDKYSVAKLKMEGNEFTFLMAAPTSILLLLMLPFSDTHFIMGWQSLLSIVLIALSKLLEFKLATVILREMSAFELKAWLGLTLFFSYATDIFIGTSTFNIVKIIAIIITAVGLFMIAKSENGHINYRKIIIPLFFYLLAKYGYGIIITASKQYVSSYLALLLGLILLALILIPFAKPIKLFKTKFKGSMFVALTKIPNAIGLVLENMVIAISMTNYSFIQPMIMVTLFFIGIIRKESTKALNIAGGIICILGILGFQLADIAL